MSGLGRGAQILGKLGDNLSQRRRGDLMVRYLGLAKIPMLAFIGPRVDELTEDRCVIRIPLTWRTKNHMRVMYIGVLTAGADLAGGVLAMESILSSPEPVALLFKDFHADYVRRADGDVLFVCEQGPQVRAAVERALETGERQNEPVEVNAYTDKPSGRELVARFTLTLTLKKS